MTGRVVLITGAASGMGRLAAQRFGRGGSRVAALDVNEVGLAETAHASGNIQRFVVDVSDAKDIEQTVERVEAEIGPIDRVLNAAAIMPTGMLLDQDSALIQRIMEVNYGGTVNVCQAVLPRMLARGRGDLVNFASIAGWLPAPHFGAYNASKFAVVAYSEVLYQENRGRGVRFACVCPPPVATPLLLQAKSKPKSLESMPPIPPEKVLDAIERALERGRLMVYPDFASALVVRLRRFLPGLVWSNLRRIEGL
jgi:NAD(P)-dependent dehydrogenase (short-subunit alcohol dehydrogenase family)